MLLFLDSMDPGNFLAIGIAAAVGVAVQIWIIRTACNIEEQLKNQKATIWLLIKLAEKQGVEPSEIQNIRDTFKII